MRPAAPPTLATVLVGALGGALLAIAGAGLLRAASAPDARALQFPSPLLLGAGASVSVPVVVPSCTVTGIRLGVAQTAGGGTLRGAIRGSHAPPSAADAAVSVTAGQATSVHLPVPAIQGPMSGRLDLTWRPTGGTAPLTVDTMALTRSAVAPGLLPCVFAERLPPMVAWLLAATVFGISGLSLAVGQVSHGARTAHAWAALAVLVASSATAMFVLTIPAGEAPDELAHLQFTRFVGSTGQLPSAVPPEGSPWRAQSYEWVQHPTYYIVTGTIGRLLGWVHTPPQLDENPASTLHRGTQRVIYVHRPGPLRDPAIRLVWLLRALHVALAGLTAWCTAALLRTCGLSARLAAVGASGLGLIPQVAALMGYHSTDGAVAAAAAMASLALARAMEAEASHRRWGLAGVAIGLALVLKLNAAFLLPAMVVALAVTPMPDLRARLAAARWLLAGVLAIAVWVPLREWLVFGDPLGREFRRALLAAAGLGPTPSPGLLDPALPEIWRTAVFEAFWARFGSLGAGPFPGSRLWTLYGVMTTGMLIAFVAGVVAALRTPGQHRVLLMCAVGAVAAVVLWFHVTLVPRPYMAIHWTPRYVQPALPLMIALTASGARWLVALTGVPARLVDVTAAASVVTLCAAAITVLRAVVLQFHFGY